MWLEYYFGKDEDETVEIECTTEMLVDTVRNQLSDLSKEELIDIIMDCVRDEELFDMFEEELKDEYYDIALDIYNNRGNYEN